MRKWVIDFGLVIDEVREKYGGQIPNLPYAELCNWFAEQLMREFPRYVIIEPTEDERDGETFAVRMVAESPFKPEVSSKYFNLVEVHPYEKVYEESGFEE